jgi:tetratricopeptide (TPR) repeat protein
LEDYLAELAYHFDNGGNAAKAVEYLGRSGQRAAVRGAHSEAISRFTRALELLPRLPDGTARDRRELDLQMALSWSSFLARGPRAPEREFALIRARELCERLRENARLMQVLVALASVRMSWGDLDLARQLTERVLTMGEETEAPATLAGAHNQLGSVRLASGQFAAARQHFERAVELLSAGPSDYYDAYFAQNSPHMLAAVLSFLGYPSTGISRTEELLTVARRSSDPNSIAVHLINYGLHHLQLRDRRMMAERANELLEIAIEHEMRINLLAATFFRGWATAAVGRDEEGIAEMLRSVSELMAAGYWPIALMLPALAETCGKHEHAKEGLDWVATGLATAEQTGVRMAEAELYRVKGEFLMIKDPGTVAEAERSLRTAIDVARRQDAKLFELRATVSLAQLMANQGRRDEARAMLADIYNWFTEGFDLSDLKEAKALLDELGWPTLGRCNA